MYLAAVGIGYFASWLAVVEQIGDVSSGGYFLIFWMFQNPPDLLFSLIKGMTMATAIVLVGCYYGYTASGGPVGVGQATAKSMILNMVLVHLIGMLGSQVFWGANPRVDAQFNASSFGMRIDPITGNRTTGFTLGWSSVGGVRYRVLFGDRVSETGFPTNFTPILRSAAEEIDPAPAGSASTQHFLDDFSRTGVPAGPARYYRVQVVQ